VAGACCFNACVGSVVAVSTLLHHAVSSGLT
jgi:hypothetical protein